MFLALLEASFWEIPTLCQQNQSLKLKDSFLLLWIEMWYPSREIVCWPQRGFTVHFFNKRLDSAPSPERCLNISHFHPLRLLAICLDLDKRTKPTQAPDLWLMAWLQEKIEHDKHIMFLLKMKPIIVKYKFQHPQLGGKAEWLDHLALDQEVVGSSLPPELSLTLECEG